MVKDERARQSKASACRLLQLVAKLDRAERVDARLHQRRVRVDRPARRALHHDEHSYERHCASRRGVPHARERPSRWQRSEP